MLPTRVARQSNGDPAEAFHREFDTALGRIFGGDGGNVRWAPYGVDVREDADHIYVEAELPGFRKEDVDITLENQTLTITAQRSEQVGDGNGNGGQAGQAKSGQQAKAAGPQSPQPQGEWLLR